MNRRKFMGLTSAAGVYLLAGLACQKRQGTKPNVIFILADDLGYGDLSCYGQSHFQTPHIDQLATNGMRFTDHYAGTTVCAPSRSSLMTGQHTGHTPIRGNKEIKPEGQQPLPANAITIAELFKNAGYVTGAFGKWGLGFPGSEGDPTNQGFDEFFGYNCQRFAHNYYPRHLWYNRDKVILKENAGNLQGKYGPELIHEKALHFMENNRNKPFFLFVPTVIPHAELFAPEAYLAKHRRKYGTEKPYKGHDEGSPHYKSGGYGSQPEPRAAFAAMVNLLDDQVGEIVAKVKELGLAEKTLILFSSDNGPHLEGGADPRYFDSNGPFRGFKRDLYEGGIRVPFIASWTGKIKPGTTSSHISAFWDFLPTVCELIQINPPVQIDGISYLPTLLSKGDQKSHAYLYWEFHEGGGKQAVRLGKWKGVRLQVKKNADSPIELYDLENDPGETKNIAQEHSDIVAKMAEIMSRAHVKSDVFDFGLADSTTP